jgi:putative peptidoglycan lipid II flippase
VVGDPETDPGGAYRHPADMTAQREAPDTQTMTTRVIVKATVLTAGLSVLGAVLGLFRDLLLALFFGATGQTDAFLVAWTIPETASPLLIEGAMAFLMVPVFVRSLHRDGSLSPVVRATLPKVAGSLAVAAAAVALAAPLFVHVLADCL